MVVDIATDNDFKTSISQNEKVVVKYFAGWCGSCRLFAPKFRRLSADDRFDSVKFLDVNILGNGFQQICWRLFNLLNLDMKVRSQLTHFRILRIPRFDHLKIGFKHFYILFKIPKEILTNMSIL